ncbi:Crp/Fnr family transcriptional regulator [Phenylobacterium soli]|nr:Crp/Fnr family transcriptional regulator [Phenylobacterium soli]
MLIRLAENLSLYGALTEEDRRAVGALPAAMRRFPAGEDIVIEGDAPAQCRVLISGQAFRHRTLPDGRRQIMSFHAQGEICDIEGLLLSMDHTVTALSPCEVAFVPHVALETLLEAHPNVMRALWRASLIDGAIFREWMLGMGRRTAKARIAHLFCEVFTRMRMAGLVEKNRCRFPVTQTHLSDALGLSVVHTNRVLQELRGEGLIAFRGGELAVLNWAGLQAAGEFDPSYLHLGASRR